MNHAGQREESEWRPHTIPRGGGRQGSVEETKGTERKGAQENQPTTEGTHGIHYAYYG